MMKKLLALLLIGALFVGCEKTATADIPAEDLLAAVRGAYGADYLPNTPIPKELLETEFGLDLRLVSDYAGEMPMIGAHPDRVLILKAAPGNADALEAQLTSVRENLIADSMQYPMNLAKVQSAAVVRKGDYLAFLLVGAVNEDRDASEADALQFAREEVQKGVAAFENALK